MNKQGKGKIEWCDLTWNVGQGCFHDCKWRMPDGQIAQCYAKSVAERWKSPSFMPDGFDKHYWHPDRLSEPLDFKKPSKIFLDSFSDLMGHWAPASEIRDVLDVCRRAHWHTFQLLTKNPRRLGQFTFPDNVWVGVSAPPTFMNGHELSADQQRRWLDTGLDALAKADAKVKWLSIEPLSFDIAPWIQESGFVPDWVVIGAASNGPRVYQPDPQWVWNLVDLFSAPGTPLFYKGNLRGNAAANPWREEFPTVVRVPDSLSYSQGELPW